MTCANARVDTLGRPPVPASCGSGSAAFADRLSNLFQDLIRRALIFRPFTRGHTLVLPKRHTVDLTDTPPEALADMVAIGQRIARAARATKLADATHIAINDGRAAFQTVFHVHLHVLPPRNGDKLSVAKGMMLRRDPDREATGRILREALAQQDAAAQD